MVAHIGALIAKGASKLSIVEPTEGQSPVVSHDRPCHKGGREEEVHRSQSVPFHGRETICREKFIWTSRSANWGGFVSRTEVASH